jgi:hypothetical protein
VPIPRFSPAFDNGTSLLHEITDANLSKFNDPVYVDRYIDRGTHHLRAAPDAERKLGHLELIAVLARIVPGSEVIAEPMLGTELEEAFSELIGLTEIAIQDPLTTERAEAIIRVVSRRKQRLTELLL